jgi:prepilin-type N-terminal cleavage/methylation domain-containing protein
MTNRLSFLPGERQASACKFSAAGTDAGCKLQDAGGHDLDQETFASCILRLASPLRTKVAPLPRYRQAYASRSPGGFSLLEVVLSLAIFAAVLVILSRLVDTGVAGAVGAEDSTAAQLYAESIMAGYTSGAVPIPTGGQSPMSVADAFVNMFSQTLLPADEEWMYEVQALPCPQAGIDYMLELTVTVRRETASADDPGYTLVRWVRNPNQETEQPAEDAAAESSASNSSSSASANAGGMQ